jgi:hypothetical protein
MNSDVTGTKRTSQWKNILKWALLILGLYTLTDFSISLLFESLYPHTEATEALKPFQNHYLAFTDSFLTSETIKANDDDPGRLSRFISEAIIPLIGLFVVLIIVRNIERLKRYTKQIMIGSAFLILLMIQIKCSFYPRVKTEFNKQLKTVTITYYKNYFFTEKEEVIPYEQIKEFEYDWKDITDFSTAQHAEVLQLFLITSTNRYFIGETRTGSHHSQNENWVEKTKKENNQLVHKAIEGLQKLIQY